MTLSLDDSDHRYGPMTVKAHNDPNLDETGYKDYIEIETTFYTYLAVQKTQEKSDNQSLVLFQTRSVPNIASK